MGVIKQNKEGVKITRKWWKFWEIQELNVYIPSRYDDAWEDIEKRNGNTTTCTIELKDWVKEDVRDQLKIKCQENLSKIKRSKKLTVNFYTWRNISSNVVMGFYYIDGEVYFDSDKSLKRHKILNKIGI